MRRTKIIATIGPASRDEGILSALIRAGVDVARLNFSHGTHDEHREVIARVRRLAAEAGRPVAVLQDLAGPKIRTGPLAAGTVHLESGRPFTLTSRDVPGDAHEVSLTWPELPRQVRPGDTLLLSDGALELSVDETTETDIRCRVVVGGPLGAHKGINLPTRSLQVPALTGKDRADLAFGLREGVDLVALSFVRSAAEVREARRLMRSLGGDLPLIAKIEKHEALGRIDEILQEVDGLMVARGDLGVEIPVERIPRVQKDLIARANAAGKPVITATQMLRSMVESPRPTRAEVTDVANAILDGSDAVMLSEETAAGRHPVRAVETMARIAEEAEATFPYDTWAARLPGGRFLDVQEAVARAAGRMAAEVGASAIATYTQTGSTTRLVAKYRPRQPVLALTPKVETYRRLALTWGAFPVLAEAVGAEEEMEREAVARAMESGWLRPGERLVVTAGLPPGIPGTTNLLKVAQAPGAEAAP
ncbi:pyruvate kinase [Dissulfurirhabdus thermomarina]|uniref:Pyruvate kinase n=1 Tax=Dissulfurirhabdus thermomarina TaxID=1765737 RepID=A0A6N9TQD5_DISTH|nr:pyruvate kinase [Dissulfurirhabdus thermomarina]NDY41647.1 pyruvate kinase [Dissulfurirhabdus thermomarina]NMX24339.1 pyruvate kinase [Dissulfurirhabdus thermomarina]